MPIRSRMSSIMGQIEPDHPELFALEFGKIAEYDFAYSLSSTNIDQSAPNLVIMYVIIRPISTKLGHNIYAHKVSDEFDYRSNRIRTSRVIFT